MTDTRQTVAVVIMASIALAASAQAHITQTKAVGTTDACALLTKEDAAAALGEAATGPKSTPARSSGGMTVSGCEYSGSGIHTLNVVLRQFPAEVAATYKAMCAQKNHDGLAGLGDMSCWYNDKHEELQVLKGQTFFSIELRRSGNPTEANVALAKKIVERIH